MKSLRQALVAAVACLVVCLAAISPALAQTGGIGAAVVQAALPRVDGFDVEQVPLLGPGTALNFALYGSPGGSATLHIDGAAHTLGLAEVQAGVYEGTYVVGRDDRIEPESRVSASLWLADRSTTVVLEEPLVLGAAQPRECPDCAIVETIRAVDEPGRPGLLGAIAGGVLGAIVGSQFGDGHGRTATGILGAVGGAYAGREIERRHNTRIRYDVVVRATDGRTQTRRYDALPPFRVGDRLRVADGTWRPVAQPVMP